MAVYCVRIIYQPYAIEPLMILLDRKVNKLRKTCTHVDGSAVFSFAQQLCFGEIRLKKFCFSCAPVRAGIEDENTTTCHFHYIPLQPLLCAYNKNWSCVSSLIAIVLVYCAEIN